MSGPPGKRPKLLVVMGPTAVGKSKLSVELALQLDAEIVSVDSIQVYDGLPIASATISGVEMRGVPHHLVSHVPVHECYSVNQFLRDAARAVQDINARGKVAIVVGGTYFFVEALLWASHASAACLHLDGASSSRSSVGGGSAERKSASSAVEEVGGSDSRAKEVEAAIAANEGDIHSLLREVDPVMAEKLHPNDRRKIARSLRVFRETGQRHSDLVRAQGESGDLDARQTLYDATVVYLSSGIGAIEARIKTRIEEMVTEGLRDEVEGLHDELMQHQQDGGEVGIRWTSGIAQALGFKEFRAYLESRIGRRDGAARTDNKQRQEEEEALFQQGVQHLVSRSQRYARQQLKWIDSKLLTQSGVPVYQVTVDPAAVGDSKVWRSSVFGPALEVARQCFFAEPVQSGTEALKASGQAPARSKVKLGEWSKITCDRCDKVCNGQSEFDQHVRSKAHRKFGARQKKRALKRKYDASSSSAPSSNAADSDSAKRMRS
jgi:tRNA dimethylallyltransferase